VQTLTYGSGTDLHRPEFSTQADLVTQPVDGSAFIDGWSGWGGRLRSAYWGFDPSHLPLNGRVWYPAGDGPFPLVLVVHGNHMMEDFSDAGYAYLGELLASRGFIVVSVDENFLNAAPAIDYLGPVPTGLTRSHDARAWLLLEHLRTWRSWSEIPGNPFYQKVDMERIALIGHSRGGNATAVAANFNRLPYYPENAHVLFNYHFNIRAVIAIAPTERSTYPAGHPATLQDTDYLVLQGAHDSEVISFDGTNQYARTVSGSGVYHFKSAVYIHGANHSRFNTAWGLTDNNPIYAPLLNTAQIMPPDEQRKIAQVYISAFLEASLRGERGYLPFFGDSRRAVGWLPAATIISRFEDSTTRSLSTFEEDANLNSTTLGGGTISADNLALWKETLVPRTSGDQGSHAVFLHWEDAKAAYSLSLPSNDVPLSPDNLLTFSLADARTPAAGIEPIDLSIELLDAGGQAARLPLSTFNILQPQLSVRRFKTGLVFETATAEPVFQSFMFPLSAFQQANPAFDPSRLTTVRFVFNITPEGTVYLDDVGFTE